jgi:putative tricarboxylic transport membrane protein
MLDALFAGLMSVTTLHALGAIAFGTLIGFVAGFIPGIQSTTALVLLLPFTFGWNPLIGMYVFAGVIGAGGNGGAISAIGMNMPGDVVNVCTALDGYPLAQRGKGSWALGVVTSSSFIGALIGIATLVAVIPVFMPFVMQIGPADLFWVMVLGIVFLTLALPGPVVPALVSVGLGMVLAAVGFGGLGSVVSRFTFGSVYLMNGLDLVVVVMGLLVVSEAITNLRPQASEAIAQLQVRIAAMGGVWDRWKDGLQGMLVPFRYPWTILRSSAVGTVVGAIPGVGGSVAQFVSYNLAYSLSRKKEEFGRGSVEGLLSAQTSVEAKEGGNVLPTVVFGIPGNVQMALVLAAWELHGLQPGIFFLQNHADVAWALILGLCVANLTAMILMVLCLPAVSYIPALRADVISIAIMGLSALAAYSVQQNLWDVVLIVLFGFLGVVLKEFGYSVIGVVIGFILGGLMEAKFYTALQSKFGSYSVFVSSIPSVIMMCVTMIGLVLIVWRTVRSQRRSSLMSAPIVSSSGPGASS